MKAACVREEFHSYATNKKSTPVILTFIRARKGRLAERPRQNEVRN